MFVKMVVMCNSFVKVLALFRVFMTVVSEDIGIPATTVEDSVDPDVTKILLDSLGQINQKEEMCSPDADCALRIYNSDGKITGAVAYCGSCPDGFECTLVEDDTRKCFLRYKCLPAVAESSAEDTIEDVAGTVHVQQGGKSWPRVFDLTGDLAFSKRSRRDDLVTNRYDIPTNPTYIEWFHPAVLEILYNFFSLMNVEKLVCSPDNVCALRAYKRDGSTTGAMTLCKSCSDGFGCTLVEDDVKRGLVWYRCLPEVAESSEDATEGTAETLQDHQGVKSWPRVFNLTGHFLVSKRKGAQDHFTYDRDQTQSSVIKREGPFKDVHEL